MVEKIGVPRHLLGPFLKFASRLVDPEVPIVGDEVGSDHPVHLIVPLIANHQFGIQPDSVIGEMGHLVNWGNRTM